MTNEQVKTGYHVISQVLLPNTSFFFFNFLSPNETGTEDYIQFSLVFKAQMADCKNLISGLLIEI